MTYKIAITGGFGTGKSTAGEILVSLGYKVIDTDEIVHKILSLDTKTIKQIASIFGDEVLDVDQTINRKALARIVFSDVQKKKELEGILHPMVKKAIFDLCTLFIDEKFIFVLIPLLFEASMDNDFDEIWCVSCSRENQILRLGLKGFTLEEIEKRNSMQMPLVEKEEYSDFVLNNDKAKIHLQSQIEKRIQELKHRLN